MQAASIASPQAPVDPKSPSAAAESGTRFSPLAQIDRGNVGQLRVAWSADLGFTGRLQGYPAAWGGLLFVSTEAGVSTFVADSGALSWQYSEGQGRRGASGLPVQAPRGSPVVLPDLAGGPTVVVSMPDAPVVVALDAVTGEVRWRSDVGRSDFAEALRTNPTRVGDLLIVGPTGADFSPVPGRLVALSIADGSVAWIFDLVPVAEDDPARATWAPFPPGRSFGIGGGSAWNVAAYDEVNDIVVFGTGEPIPNDQLDPRRFDGDADPTEDLYTSSFVALDAGTGSLLWYRQIVPADEWGYDQHTVPIVTDISIDGLNRRVVLLATTTGFVMVVDVMTGETIASHKMFAPGNVHIAFDETGASVIDPAQRRMTSEQVIQVCPGGRWANIAPGAFSPVTGLLYRPNDTVCQRQGAGSAPDDWQPGARPTWLLADVRQPDDFFDRWGALTALDPVTGDVKWSFDLPYPHDAGALVTAGGLVFSAFADRQFRAFDATTGDVLWTQVLTAHSDSSPITFEVDGVQYVAIMAGRDTPVHSLPASGLPDSVPGSATLFVFSLAGTD